MGNTVEKINEKTLVVLAAGMGARFGGTKQLASISPSNETIVDFSVYDALRLGFTKIVFVVRKEILAEFRRKFDRKLDQKVKVSYVCQNLDDTPNRSQPLSRTKPWGTGHAVLAVKNHVKGNFCVVNADDFYGRQAFEKMSRWLDEIDEADLEFSMIGYPVGLTLSESGGVSRGKCIVGDDGYLAGIVEQTGIEKRGGVIVSCSAENSESILEENTIVSMNFWGFTDKIFRLLEERFEIFVESEPTNDEEFLLPEVIASLLESGFANVKVLKTTGKWLGVTYKEDQDWAKEQLMKLRENGDYPAILWK